MKKNTIIIDWVIQNFFGFFQVNKRCDQQKNIFQPTKIN